MGIDGERTQTWPSHVTNVQESRSDFDLIHSCSLESKSLITTWKEGDQVKTTEACVLAERERERETKSKKGQTHNTNENAGAETEP